MPSNWSNRKTWPGYDLPIMGMNSVSVDLIYLDPLFNSKANYVAPTGREAARVEFKYTLSFQDIDFLWLDPIEAKHPQVNTVIHAAISMSDES